MRRVSECRSCNAAIIWTTTKKGKKMPIDAEPAGKGPFILEPPEEDPIAVFIGEKDPYTGERFTSHFSTCPNAEQHRRSR